MSGAVPSSSFAGSTREPTRHPDELKAWWHAEMAVYRPYKVKVVKQLPDTAHGLVRLTFVLATEEAEPRKTPPREFTIDVPGHPKQAWTDRPSTAQMVVSQERPYGFLFLTDEWAKSEGVDPDVYAESGGTGGGGKWPIGTDAERVLLAMQDETTRKKLLAVLDAISR